MHEVVAPLGQRLDDRRHARHADLETAVEGDIDLGDRAQAPVDVGVGADHLDLEPGHPAIADLLDRVGDAVHPAESVGDQRDPRSIAVAAGQLELFAAQEGSRGRVGNRGQAGVEQPECPAREIELRATVGHRDELSDDLPQLAFVDPPGAAEQIRMAQLSLLEQLEEAVLVDVELHRAEPSPQHRAGVLRT